MQSMSMIKRVVTQLVLLSRRLGVKFFQSCSGSISAAQFFAFFAKTKNGRAKDFSRKMTREKFAKKCPKRSKIDPIFSLKISPFLIQNYLNFILVKK